MKRLLGVGLALLLALLVWPAVPAFAHAEYDHSVPAIDEVVPQAPTTVEVYFLQKVFRQEGSNYVRVFDDSGVQVSDGDGVIDDNDRTHITAQLQGGLGDGRYIVRWKTLSDEDGDVADGAFCFYVAVQPTAAQAAECAALAAVAPTLTQVPTLATTTPPAAGPTATPAPPPPAGADSGGSGISAGLFVIAALVGAGIVATVSGSAIVWFRRVVE